MTYSLFERYVFTASCLRWLLITLDGVNGEGEKNGTDQKVINIVWATYKRKICEPSNVIYGARLNNVNLTEPMQIWLRNAAAGL